MKVYRVSKRDPKEGHQGYTYHTSRAEAERFLQKSIDSGWRGEIEERSVNLTSKGVMNLLEQWASHPDNP